MKKTDEPCQSFSTVAIQHCGTVVCVSELGAVVQYVVPMDLGAQGGEAGLGTGHRQDERVPEDHPEEL